VSDPSWLAALGPGATVRARTPLAGGYVAASVERVEVDLDGATRSVVVKRTTAAEVAAMRAVAVVRDDRLPRMIATGRDADGHWILLPHHDGPALAAGEPVPAAVWEVLGAVHRHWAGRRPRGLPVVDAAWWRRTITEHTLVAVRGAAERTGDRDVAAVAAALPGWAVHPVAARALAVLPRTLCHGDAHPGNVLLPASGPVLIDWGSARVAPPGLDVVTLGGDPPAAYTGPALPPELVPVHAHWARVQAHVQYLAFAADHLGTERVLEMAGTVERSLAALG
jgi:aminoglycoside phosphotransferase (APT) family kinase protein